MSAVGAPGGATHAWPAPHTTTATHGQRQPHYGKCVLVLVLFSGAVVLLMCSVVRLLAVNTMTAGAAVTACAYEPLHLLKHPPSPPKHTTTPFPHIPIISRLHAHCVSPPPPGAC